MMRKTIVTALAAFVVLSLAPATHADSDSDKASCVGTGGFTNGGWNFFETDIATPNSLPLPIGISEPLQCEIVSSDELPPQLPSPPALTVPPVIPAPPSIDPTNPLGTVFSIIDAICTPEPGLCGTLIGSILGVVGGGPVDPMRLSLSASGDFRCGKGTLSGTGFLFTFFQEPDRSLVWSATFTNGVGTLTGTATSDCFEQGAECGQVKKLGGMMLINDGAPAHCDDSAGNSQVLVYMTIDP